MALRSPICTVVGHVDHGKSSLLDKIRGTAIVRSEAGAITQAIGASIVPLAIIKKICGESLMQAAKFTIPGLLFIDTPGHAAFTNMRKRGGNLADIAILVISIQEGVMPQTKESIEILKHYKTPFVIAATKIDLVRGWKHARGPLASALGKLEPSALQEMETKVYEIVGKLSEFGFESDRFDRVSDYTKQVAIIPISSVTGDGIAELLMIISGLAQKYLEQSLKYDASGPAKGTILEVKEEKGIGKSMDVIIYDGTLSVNDPLIIGGLREAIVTKVRGLFEPAPLAEMRDKKTRFLPVKKVSAATGVKIVAPDIADVLAGMPLLSSPDVTQAKKQVMKDVEQVIIENGTEGIVIKADTLGSLEALREMLSQEKIPIKKASIGNITKKDIMDAAANYETDFFHSAVLGFNVQNSVATGDPRAVIILSDVIYQLIDKYKEWVQQQKQKKEAEKVKDLMPPCKIQLLKGYIFRQSNPAIIGAEILAGVAKTGLALMNQKGVSLTTIKGMQADKEAISEATKGKQVAISLPGVTVGRQINEGDILYSDIPENEFRRFKEFRQYLSEEQKMLLRQIGEMKRIDNPVWGI